MQPVQIRNNGTPGSTGPALGTACTLVLNPGTSCTIDDNWTRPRYLLH